MVERTWKAILPLTICALLFLFEDWASTPSCKLVPASDPNEKAERAYAGADESAKDLKVMIVADLSLLGSESSFVSLYFRDYYLSKFFKKSFYSMKPDMLLVMGDVSARGSELTKNQWVSVLHQFHRIIGPFLGLPFHVVLGDRDIGCCNGIDAKSIQWISRHLPGLDSAGCGSFEINNVSFVSLNSVALLCGNNELRFSVEKVIEKESTYLQMETLTASKTMDDYGNNGETLDHFGWRKNVVSSGSGPVLLLHIPLHQTINRNCEEGKNFWTAASFHVGSNTHICRDFVGSGSHELLQMIPPNATEYIFQALKPRIIFSAHIHEFRDHTHSDGTREIIVPSMTWSARDDPGFVITTFHKDGNAVTVSYCSLTRESHVILAYAALILIVATTWLVARTPELTVL